MVRASGKYLAVFSLLAALVLLAGCSSSESIKAAEAGVAHFRELMAAKKFDQVYAEASDEFKAASTAADLTKLLAAIDRKLGAFKSSTSNGWRVNYNTRGTSVVYGVKSLFENGSGDETFSFLIKDGKAVLAGYNIQSSALILN